MTHHLQKLLDTLLQSGNITAAEKSILKKGLKEASSELEKYALQLTKAENTRADTEYLIKKLRDEVAKDKVQLATFQRELEIEAALERVRARAMSMQNSQELNELIGTVFSELTKLDLTLTRCLIIIYDKETKDARWWMANSETPETPMNFLLKYHDHPPFLAYIDAWQSHSVKWTYELKGQIKRDLALTFDNILSAPFP